MISVDRIAKIRERVKACEFPINEPSKIQAVGWMKMNAIEYAKDLLDEIDRLKAELAAANKRAEEVNSALWEFMCTEESETFCKDEAEKTGKSHAKWAQTVHLLSGLINRGLKQPENSEQASTPDGAESETDK